MKKVIKLTDYSMQQQAIRSIKDVGLGDAWEVEIRPSIKKRSYNQNDLFWLWMSNLAKYFSNKENTYKKEDIYKIVVHKFLGYETVKIGETVIEDQLRSTKSLSKDDFFFFMTQVDEWALSLGLRLPSPEGSQYEKTKKKNEGIK